MANWTTEDVRLRILRGFAQSSVRDRLERQFSEWLAAHDAEVAAAALEDAADAILTLELPWGTTVRKRFFEGIQAATAALRARAAALRGGGQ